jgi:hypothetical protein
LDRCGEPAPGRDDHQPERKLGELAEPYSQGARAGGRRRSRRSPPPAACCSSSAGPATARRASGPEVAGEIVTPEFVEHWPNQDVYGPAGVVEAIRRAEARLPVGPFVSHQLAVPAQQCLVRNQEQRGPLLPWKRAACPCEQDAVEWGEPGPASLAAEYTQLLPKDQDLQILGRLVSGSEDEQAGNNIGGEPTPARSPSPATTSPRSAPPAANPPAPPQPGSSHCRSCGA